MINFFLAQYEIFLWPLPLFCCASFLLSIYGISLCRYGYDWRREEANKNLLRTHTTAVSSRMLYKLAQVNLFR